MSATLTPAFPGSVEVAPGTKCRTSGSLGVSECVGSLRQEPINTVYLASYYSCGCNSFALSVSSEDYCSCFLFNGYSIERSYKLHFKPLARNIIYSISAIVIP